MIKAELHLLPLWLSKKIKARLEKFVPLTLWDNPELGKHLHFTAIVFPLYYAVNS